MSPKTAKQRLFLWLCLHASCNLCCELLPPAWRRVATACLYYRYLVCIYNAAQLFSHPQFDKPSNNYLRYRKVNPPGKIFGLKRREKQKIFRWRSGSLCSFIVSLGTGEYKDKHLPSLLFAPKNRRSHQPENTQSTLKVTTDVERVCISCFFALCPLLA